MPTLHGITVRHALSLDCMQGARVVAGGDGLERIITSVNVMEVPDILPWVKEGQLLLTTGFSIKDDLAAQEQLVPDLAKRGLAALGFKPKRYVDRIPEIMIQEANAHSLPLIELPPEASHPQVLQGVYSELVSRQASLLKKTAEVHEVIMSVLLGGGGLADVAETLEQLVDNPASIYDTEGELLASSPQAKEITGAGGSPSLPPRQLQELKLKRHELPLGNAKCSAVMAPVVAGSRLYGQVIAWEKNRPLKQFDLITLEQAATLSALVILNHRAVQSVETKYKNEFLYDWLRGDMESAAELIQRSETLGWNVEGSFILLVIEIDGYDGMLSGSRRDREATFKAKEKIQRVVCRAMDRRHDYYILGDRGGYFVLLVRAKAAWSDRAAREKAREVAVTIQQDLKAMLSKVSCSIGMGRFYQDIMSIPRSFQEARKAVEIGRRIRGDGQITHFDDLGVYRLLYHVDQPEEMEKFARETVLPLVEYDYQHGTDLVPTLEAFFGCNGNLSKVARELFAHYNTVLYRLERIKEVAGVDLDDPEQRLNLQVALKIMRMNIHALRGA